MLAGLGIRQRSVLLILMAEAVEVTNPDLLARWGLTLDGAARRQLNDMGLVASRKVGRSFAHELTDKGWRWCDDELTAAVPPRAGSAGGALVRGAGRRGPLPAARGAGARRGVRRRGRRGPDPAPGHSVAGTDPAPGDTEARVRDAYRRVAGAGRDWVGLAEVRGLLGDLPPEEVDAALTRLARQPDVRLAGEPNRKALTDADHAAAVQVGGEERHLLAIEAP